MAFSLYGQNSWNLDFFVNSVPKKSKMSVEAVTVANSTFLFVKYFWVKFVISVAIYGNFFIRE